MGKSLLNYKFNYGRIIIDYWKRLYKNIKVINILSKDEKL